MNSSKEKSLFIPLTFLSLFISLLGLIAVYNASVIEGFNAFNDRFYFAKQQFSWLIIGVVVFFVISRLKPQFFRRFALPFLVISLLLMLLVVIPGIGVKVQGARRWLSFGFFRLQPSELLKVSLVLYLSVWLENKRKIQSFLALLAVSLGLVLLQSDMGTAVVVGSICFGLYFLSGSPMKHVAIIVGLIFVSTALFIATSPYRLERLRTFVDPTQDTLGRSYHINQVVLGLGSGGMFGVGLGRSRQKYSYLPEATTDSIFAIIGEEAGFVGGATLILLLLSLCLLAFKIASRTTNQYQMLVASGVALLISSQTIVNLSAMVALIPLTGVPLPLISYGGSSLISTFISLGILGSIARNL